MKSKIEKLTRVVLEGLSQPKLMKLSLKSNKNEWQNHTDEKYQFKEANRF